MNNKMLSVWVYVSMKIAIISDRWMTGINGLRIFSPIFITHELMKKAFHCLPYIYIFEIDNVI